MPFYPYQYKYSNNLLNVKKKAPNMNEKSLNIKPNILLNKYN